MDARIRYGILNLLLLGSGSGLFAQSTDSLPAGVTAALIAEGKKLFGGPGLCIACHGTDAKGVIGPDLTDKALLHYDGSYEALVKVVTEGVDEKASKTGQVMPAKGGSGISAEQVRAVAAYVWSLRKPSWQSGDSTIRCLV